MKLLLLETAAWFTVVVACGLVATACPPSPVVPSPDADAVAPPPTPVASPDATPPAGVGDCASACAAMASAGCVVLADCAQKVCQVNADPRFKHYDVVCLTQAKTAADVRKCGADCSPAAPTTGAVQHVPVGPMF
jgi:hypothetical protein